MKFAAANRSQTAASGAARTIESQGTRRTARANVPLASFAAAANAGCRTIVDVPSRRSDKRVIGQFGCMAIPRRVDRLTRMDHDLEVRFHVKWTPAGRIPPSPSGVASCDPLGSPGLQIHFGAADGGQSRYPRS